MGKTYKANNLYKMAQENRENITEDSEIEKRDITEVFYRELDIMVRDGEITYLTINAKPRLGKSTAGMAIGAFIFERLVHYGMAEKGAKFGIKNIARDQQEYSKRMREHDTGFTVMVIDESNSLEDSGANVSVERKMLEDFSNIQAGRYVHLIGCTPRDLIDPNTDMILTVITTDKETMTTLCKVHFRYFEGGTEFRILLGHIKVDVSPIIYNWIKHVQKVFYKQDKTEKDKEFIRKWREKDWYTEYYIRKHQKMDLLVKEGVTRPRDLDYAEMKKNVIKQLTPLTSIGNVLDKNIVKNFVRKETRELRLNHSIVGCELDTNDVYGILKCYMSQRKLIDELMGLSKALKEGKIDGEYYNEKRKAVETALNGITEAIKSQTDELDKLIKIRDKYNEMVERKEVK